MAARIDPARLDRVEALFVALVPARKIERELAAEWGLARRTIRKYVTIVRRRLAASAKPEDAAAVRVLAETVIKDAIEVAKRNGRAGDMVAAATRLMEMHGAYSPKIRLEHSVKNFAELLNFAEGAGDAEQSDSGEAPGAVEE